MFVACILLPCTATNGHMSQPDVLVHGAASKSPFVCVAVQVSEGLKIVAALPDHLSVDASHPLAVLTQVWHMH